MLALVSVSALSLSPTIVENRRQLSYTSILNYNPGSKVTDHANIDLDQKAMEAALGTKDYTTAKAIYEDGAYSKPTAECTLTSGTAGQAISKKDTVTFTTASGASTTGKAYASYDTAATKIAFTYSVSSDRVQPATTACYVGGLLAADYQTDGCIAGSAGTTDPSSGTSAGQSTFTIGSTTYTATCINKGKRSLQGFSTKAQAVMYDCPKDTAVSYENGCPYTSYKPYYDYYGVYDYANQIVLAALDGTAITGFTNGGFSLKDSGDSARKEYTKKGTAYMNAWMYAIREFEDAIDDCTSGDLTANALSSGPVHAWDEGVAFYAGSLMEYDALLAGNLAKLDKEGKLAYTLANKRCKNYKTCGPDGDALLGEAKANIDLFDLFQLGQYELLAGNCAKIVPIKNDIVKKMTVPLVQGTLRYAYKVAHLSGADKEKAEGGIFAAAVLPQLHACAPAAATTVFRNMGWGADKVDYPAVKAAFESCYASMGITCADVGGLWNTATDAYYKDGGSDASPCVDAATAASEGLDGLTLAMIIVAAVILILCIIIVCAMYNSEKKGKPIFAPIGPKATA